MKNLTYDVEEKSPVFNEVQTLLLSALVLLEGNTKKENGITVAPVKKNEKPLTFPRKRKYLELTKKKKKSATRYGYARDKKETYSKIKIESKTKQLFENEIIEEVVCDDVDMEEEEFNVDIPVLNVFDESDSEHDTVEESPRCLLSFNDLKLAK